jgi:hypothetical protein
MLDRDCNTGANELGFGPNMLRKPARFGADKFGSPCAENLR